MDVPPIYGRIQIPIFFPLMNAAAFSAESLGFTVRKLSGDFSTDRNPVVDVTNLFPDAGKMPEGNPTMTDDVRRIAIELIGAK